MRRPRVIGGNEASYGVGFAVAGTVPITAGDAAVGFCGDSGGCGCCCCCWWARTMRRTVRSCASTDAVKWRINGARTASSSALSRGNLSGGQSDNPHSHSTSESSAAPSARRRLHNSSLADTTVGETAQITHTRMGKLTLAEINSMAKDVFFLSIRFEGVGSVELDVVCGVAVCLHDAGSDGQNRVGLVRV
jgi:hypothetical protein